MFSRVCRTHSATVSKIRRLIQLGTKKELKLPEATYYLDSMDTNLQAFLHNSLNSLVTREIRHGSRDWLDEASLCSSKRAKNTFRTGGMTRQLISIKTHHRNEAYGMKFNINSCQLLIYATAIGGKVDKMLYLRHKCLSLSPVWMHYISVPLL